MNKLLVFINGMREFRSDVTTAYEDERDLNIYDAGRELAHILTFRYWDGSHL